MVVYECRLVFHKKNKPTDDDVLFCSKDFPSIKPGCLLEIYHQENEKHHLVKIESVNSNYQQKDTISLENLLATSFKLTHVKTLKFQIIDENLITLDVLDLIIRDQYLSRSDMYRFINSIRHSVLQMNKKLEFGPYRGNVGEMWCKGQRNHSGYFGANTRVVFRSATSVVHIFIQMSSEMWEFDYFGELYFDKAINFISDLFVKWQDNNCGHDMTIVLFSRLFYKNLNEENLSENVRGNIKVDQKGRFYEDFYIVVVQNERYVMNEWRKVIKTLKFRFNNYKTELEEFQEKNFSNDCKCESYLSSAEDANFLETLNMTLNLYENYYIDRNFERTGKVCVLITAGSGVYNVDRIQTHITKQRICDLGVGMDLVCIGEQPLHAVPLFIFHQKSSSKITDNHYYIPYWINHSFYRSVNELQAIQMGKFIPRIKVAFEQINNSDKMSKCKEDHMVSYELSPSSLNFGRKFSKPEIPSGKMSGVISTSNNCDRGGLFHDNHFGSYNSKDDSFLNSTKPGQKRTNNADNRKALFNPFAPNRFNVRTTSNSRRWSHVFPIDKNNKPIQLHHQLAINNPNLYGFEKRKSINMAEAWKNYYKLYNDHNNKSSESPESSSSPTTHETLISPKSPFRENEDSSIITEKSEFPIVNDKISDDSIAVSPLPSSFQGGSSQKSFPQGSSIKGSVNRRVHTLFTEGEQKWSWDQPKEEEGPINHMDVEEAIKLIGVDWKSLTLPAILPITSDYYPSSRVLEDEFLESNYQLMANSLNNSDSTNHLLRKPLGIHEVFQELIYQRLNQGFQLISKPPTLNTLTKDSNKKILSKTNADNIIYRFSLGRIYHSIQMKQDLIHVTQYSPRHTNYLDDVAYNYCLKMPDSKDFMMSKTKFSTQMLEKFNWNYHDHYILNYGGNSNEDTEEDECRYKLIPSLRFWRSRFYLLPTHTATKTIIDTDKNKKIRCDIYDEKSLVEQNSLIEEFFKFLEVINKIKRRTPNSKKSTIQSACIVTTANPVSPIRPPIYHRHSTTHEPNHYNQLSELLNNSSNPVTPIEKYPRQFTFDSIDNGMKYSSGLELDKLTDTSPYSRVLDEMMSPQNGLTFLQSPEFPNEYTFTSYEAVNWCITKIDKINDVKSAVVYLQKLMNLKYIFHASEFSSHKFIYGFVFYCLSNSNKLIGNGWLDTRTISNTNSGSSSLTNLATEDTDNSLKSRKRIIEWVEVYLSSNEIDGKLEREWMSEYLEKPFTGFHLAGETNKPPIDTLQNFIFVMKSIPERYLVNCLTYKNVHDYIGNSHDPEMLFEKNGILYKKVVLDIENEKSERAEWGVFQYQASYHPTMAFEFMIQWLVATGGKLSEKISQWSKKKPVLQLVPVPCDPFAFPSSINSDPLRGPIFVPLNIECLIENSEYINSSNHSINTTIDHLFEEFPYLERIYRLMLLQEAILKRFGFIRESCVNYITKEHLLKIHTEKIQKKMEDKLAPFESFPNMGGISLNWSYIHYSGGMFAMIPSYNKYSDISDVIPIPTKNNPPQFNVLNPIVRHINTDEDTDGWETINIGFLWSWNKMLTRKWTTTAMVIDEQFQDRMLADFREFCSNTDNRLKQFYLDAKATAKKYFSEN